MKYLLLLILILPITLAYAQINNTNDTIKPITIDDLNRGHSIITDIMVKHSNQDFELLENQVITMTYVDPDNGTLVVGFDPIMHILDIKRDTGDLLDGIPTNMIYTINEYLSPDVNNTQQYIDLYNHRCVNPNKLLCDKLANKLNIDQTQYAITNNTVQKHNDLDDYETYSLNTFCKKIAYEFGMTHTTDQSLFMPNMIVNTEYIQDGCSVPYEYHNKIDNKFIVLLDEGVCVINNVSSQNDIDSMDISSLCPDDIKGWYYTVFTPVYNTGLVIGLVVALILGGLIVTLMFMNRNKSKKTLSNKPYV